MSEHDRGTLSSMSDGLNLRDANTEMPRVTRMLATSAKIWTTISLMDKKGLGVLCVPWSFKGEAIGLSSALIAIRKCQGWSAKDLCDS